uniref:Uncharacterized protein n=1 Tax=Anguilla anguilla TaxID=7936 RepID=A0A0E9XH34_ANGAN
MPHISLPGLPKKIPFVGPKSASIQCVHYYICSPKSKICQEWIHTTQAIRYMCKGTLQLQLYSRPSEIRTSELLTVGS